MSEVTRLIDAMGRGDADAARDLLPLVYDELRRLARAQMANERAAHTLQATALVHEAYVRLIDGSPAGWNGRQHFFGAAAEAMRRILVEHARRRASIKRGGARKQVAAETDELPAIASPCDGIDDLLALDEALGRLEREEPASAELVKLLYFAGLSLDDSAAALGLSRTTTYRRWVWARAWLYDAIRGAGESK